MPKRFIHLFFILGCAVFLGWPTSAFTADPGAALAKAPEKTEASVEAAKGDAEQSEINWYSYDDGIKRIKADSKKGYLHFYTDWCGYCKLMNRQTFSDADVISYMNTNFIPIRIDAEAEKEVAKKYGVYRFPSNWFLAENTEDIAKHPGFIPPKMMLRMLEYINSDSYQSLQFQEYLDEQEPQQQE